LPVRSVGRRRQAHAFFSCCYPHWSICHLFCQFEEIANKLLGKLKRLIKTSIVLFGLFEEGPKRTFHCGIIIEFESEIFRGRRSRALQFLVRGEAAKKMREREGKRAKSNEFMKEDASFFFTCALLVLVLFDLFRN